LEAIKAADAHLQGALMVAHETKYGVAPPKFRLSYEQSDALMATANTYDLWTKVCSKTSRPLFIEAHKFFTSKTGLQFQELSDFVTRIGNLKSKFKSGAGPASVRNCSNEIVAAMTEEQAAWARSLIDRGEAARRRAKSVNAMPVRFFTPDTKSSEQEGAAQKRMRDDAAVGVKYPAWPMPVLECCVCGSAVTRGVPGHYYCARHAAPF